MGNDITPAKRSETGDVNGHSFWNSRVTTLGGAYNSGLFLKTRFSGASPLRFEHWFRQYAGDSVETASPRPHSSVAGRRLIAWPNDLTAREIDQLIDSFPSRRRITSSPGGPPTGSTAASQTLLRNLDRAAPALLAALDSSNNDIRRHAAHTLGASKKLEFAAPLERAIAAELTSRIHQPYPASGIPEDRYFAALRAMVLAAERTGGSAKPENHRVMDRSPCDASENAQPSCLDNWLRALTLSAALPVASSSPAAPPALRSSPPPSP
jgi:hypothetical protein